MKLHNLSADVFSPDGGPLSRITHLGIGAHQDDLEFMAFHGIVACFHHEQERWFGGVTCTDGAGSSRTGDYASYSDEAMRRVRLQEQRAAAVVGRYAGIIQLGYSSISIKSPSDKRLAEDLRVILSETSPEVVYTHNLADKHDTHIGVTAAVVEAIRGMAPAARPKQVLGCEMWRGLDWLGDDEKITLDVSGRDHLAAALNGIFDSQIAGGKRYDLATIGRRSANATFFDSHASDAASQMTIAMDLTPLITDDSLDPIAFAMGFIDRFRDDVRNRLVAHF